MGRKRERAPYKAPEERRNPQTLRDILFELREMHFDGDSEKAAKILAPHKPRKNKRNSPLSGNIINKIIDDENDIKYWQLECFAVAVGVPTFVLLLFSRIISDLNDLNSDSEDDKERANNNLADIKIFLKDIQSLVEKIDQEDFDVGDIHEWIERYSNVPPLLKGMETK